jgi:hypothetical protein
MDDGMVSLKTVQEHYGIWRWRIEKDSSNELVKIWSDIDGSGLPDDTKVRLANVAWALGAFERSYDLLLADIVRAEKARNEGAPPLMKHLTGPYEDSLDYLLGMGLWMDLGDVLVAYRTIAKRIDRGLKDGGVLRRSSTPWKLADVREQVEKMEARALPELGTDPVTIMANTILHRTWDPSVELTMAFKIYWKGSDPETLDFAEGDVRGALSKLVDETVEQIRQFLRSVLERHPAAPEAREPDEPV